MISTFAQYYTQDCKNVVGKAIIAKASKSLLYNKFPRGIQKTSLKYFASNW